MKAIHTRSFIPAGLLVLLAVLAPPGAAWGAAPTQVDGGIQFSLQADDAAAVYLAGDFNGWDASGLPMAKDDDGVWTVIVELAAGEYEYKFVVDGEWREDPGNPLKKSDPFGGSNSLLTVNADGSVVGHSAAVAASPPPPAGGDVQAGPPVGTDAGVLFAFSSPGAGSVSLAGSFNGWSATDWPMAENGSGIWTIVKPLDEGAHQYKFVVDGSWVTDPENPESQEDGYGGSNSLVTVDANGQVIEGAGGAPEGDQKKSSDLNTKLYLGGRYLTRFEMARNVTVGEGEYAATDPRWNLQRPTQSVDLNFEAEVSEIASTLMRIRLDSDQNIIQNNVAGFLDEANLFLQPKNFNLKAYWNQEVFTGRDLLQSIGNIDLPGTILHDHLNYGKGTAGAAFDARPWGFDFDAYFANVHNADYYNDPDLFDNTGEDVMNVRLGRRFGNFEAGIPFYANRALVWLDFGTLVTLSSTGIPSLDDYLAKSGDTSTWFETESHVYQVGTDLRYKFGDKFMLGGQFMYVDYLQRFVTGNESSEDKKNGSIDVPFLERDRRLYMAQADWTPNVETKLSVKQIFGDMKGANGDQRYMEYTYKYQDAADPEDNANGNIYFEILNSPAKADLDSTDVTFDWHDGGKDVTLWLRRAVHDLDFAEVDRTVPQDSTLTDRTQASWYAAARLGLGRSSARLGRGELEIGFADTDFGVEGYAEQSLEFIFRYDRDLTRNTGLIADLRWISYDVSVRDDTGAEVNQTPSYFAPFAGFRYTPIDQLELVLGYGVDPVDYSIDYGGRQMGRWWFRQNYLFDFPDATPLDAEQALEDAEVFTLRVQLLF